MSRVERVAASLVVVATLAATLAGKPAFALGIAVGGLLSVANLCLLRALMRALAAAALENGSGRNPRQLALGVLLMLKFVLMAGLLYLVITYVPLDPKGLLVGLSLVVLSIMGEGFRLALQTTREERAQEPSSDG